MGSTRPFALSSLSSSLSSPILPPLPSPTITHTSSNAQSSGNSPRSGSSPSSSVYSLLSAPGSSVALCSCQTEVSSTTSVPSRVYSSWKSPLLRTGSSSSLVVVRPGHPGNSSAPSSVSTSSPPSSPSSSSGVTPSVSPSSSPLSTTS